MQATPSREPAPIGGNPWPGLFLALAAASVFLVILSGFNFLDPDVFHEMALFREILHEGRVPKVDHFAYTPTVFPVVHHEWGTGAVLYAVSRFGPTGLLALRYALAATVAVVAGRVARVRGAGWIGIAVVSPIAAVMVSNGLATVRAQAFTLLFTSILLLMLEGDRHGGRRWLFVWPVLYVLWLNLHGGFVAGVGILTLYGVEELLAKHRFPWRLLVLSGALAALVLVNPYGVEYPVYLVHALSFPRIGVAEWGPIWTGGWTPVTLLTGAVLLYAYALFRVGWRNMPGWLIYLACAYMALRHFRHLSLLGVVVLAYLPGWLQATPIGRWLEERNANYPSAIRRGAALLGVVCLAVAAYRRPWHHRIPSMPDDVRREEPVVYPYGAVQYLKELRFRGNVMTPFMADGFVSWEMYPAVKVSLDGRYEVAYPLQQVSEIVAFYAAKPGWRATLDHFSTDLVLVQEVSPLSKPLAEQPAWQRVYRDGVFELFARPGLKLPNVDRNGQPIISNFP